MTLWKTLQSELDQRQLLPPLHVTEVFDPVISEEILEADDKDLTGGQDVSAIVVQATKIGLLVWNDDLDAAHTLAQDLNDPLGSYWHAIIHRREGDYDNAKYWFHRVGGHPIFPAVYAQSTRLWKPSEAWGKWLPDAFVDAVEAAEDEQEDSHATGEALRRIQVVEFSFLLRHPLLDVR